jgi:hypothetical protein
MMETGNWKKIPRREIELKKEQAAAAPYLLLLGHGSQVGRKNSKRRTPER